MKRTDFSKKRLLCKLRKVRPAAAFIPAAAVAVCVGSSLTGYSSPEYDYKALSDLEKKLLASAADSVDEETEEQLSLSAELEEERPVLEKLANEKKVSLKTVHTRGRDRASRALLQLKLL